MTKREIGMEKLMKYVEEMQKEGINICRPQFQEYYLVEMMLISKYYGLIKRLVENDKIDLDKVEEKSDLTEYLIGTPTKVYENIIMILSISDTPIEDLISYLR